jgi:RHS repeat-associated protein
MVTSLLSEANEPQNYKFEGKERDTETANDDFGAREYSWRFGRWLSSDRSVTPSPIPYANLSNPQTLNLSAMVVDDPESFADLDGHRLNTPGQPGGAGNGECSGFWSCFENALITDNAQGSGDRRRLIVQAPLERLLAILSPQSRVPLKLELAHLPRLLESALVELA